MNTAIAWLGLGHMGSPMARRLLDHGHQLIVWNRSPERAQPLAEAGARVAQSPAAAASEADVVITMLSDPDAVDGVLFGENGAVNGLRPGSTLVEMSTIGPQAVRTIAGKLPQGIDMVDAPVVGSTTAAMSGTLTVLAGGSAEVLDRVEPILSNLGTVRRCGQLASGQSLKLVVNTALLTAVADAVGVARERALEALKTGPLGTVVGRVTSPAQFSISLAAKDLRLALDAASGPLPVTSAAAARMDDAIAAGLADADIGAIV